MPQGEPGWKAVRDWLSFVLAIGALAVSTTTAYVTSLRELSELHGIVGSAPFMIPDNKRFKVVGDVSVLFINAGNRPISVIGAEVIVGEATVAEGRNTCSGIHIDTDLEFTVIDEKKIVEKNSKMAIPKGWSITHKDLDFKKEENTWMAGDEKLEGEQISFVSPELLKKGRASVCVAIHFVTARDQGTSAIEVHQQTFSETHFDVKSAAPKKRPVLIHRRQDWTFW
jgi:hypothetical protein